MTLTEAIAVLLTHQAQESFMSQAQAALVDEARKIVSDTAKEVMEPKKQSA